MKKIIQIILVFVLIASFIPTATKSNAAKENADLSDNVLAPYIVRLQELNRELGTDYAIPDEATYADTGSDYNEVVEFYTSMTLDEFESYIRDMYERYGVIEDSDYRIVDEEEFYKHKHSSDESLDEENVVDIDVQNLNNPDSGFQYMPWDMEDERRIPLGEN